MARKRLHVTRVRKIHRRGQDASVNVTRAEFNAVIGLLNQRGDVINRIRRELDIQFTRIAQLQQEVDALKRRA